MNAMTVGPVLMLLMIRSGGSDLLDYVDSAAYWKQNGVTVSVASMLTELDAKQRPEASDDEGVRKLIAQLGDNAFAKREAAQQKLVAMGAKVLPYVERAAQGDDPEVAERARKIVAALTPKRTGLPRHKARSIRQLMAIRTLGELKDAGALPALRELLDAKALFVAEYARAAIAAIEGKPFQRPRTDVKTRLADAWVLPKDCGAVGQIHDVPKTPLPLEHVLARDLVLAMQLARFGPDLAETVAEGVLGVAEVFGNVRFEAVTIGIEANVGRNAGHAVLVIRGLYDPKAFGTVMASPKAPLEEVDGVSMFRTHRGADSVFLMPSEKRLVIVGGDDVEGAFLKKLAGGLRRGDRPLARNAKIVKLIGSVDTSLPLWAVTTLPPAFKQMPMLAPFEHVTLVGQRNEKGELGLKLTAVGRDPAEVTTSVEQFKAAMAGIARDLDRPSRGEWMLLPFGEMLATTIYQVDDAKAVITATFKAPSLSQQLILPLLQELLGRTLQRRTREATPLQTSIDIQELR